MKICQVVPRYPPRTGGVERHVRELSNRLVEKGHEVTVVTGDAGSGVEQCETRSGVNVRRHRGVSPGGAFHIAPGVVRSVRRMEADVVHAHNYHALPAFFAAVAINQEHFVVTPHYHGGSPSDFRDRLLSLYKPLGGWALRRAGYVVAVSEWEQERLRRDFGVDAEVIPNGIDVERFRDITPHRRTRPYLLTVGRLEEYKGVQNVIRALTKIPDFDLLVAGEGDYADQLRDVAVQAGVANRVEFLGYVTDEDLPGLYAGAAAFITMSAFEAYGMTVGEALATGTPCVIREEGALRDWTGWDGCVGVDEPGREPIAAAVKAAVGRETDSESLPTWEDVVDEVASVYQQAQT